MAKMNRNMEKFIFKGIDPALYKALQPLMQDVFISTVSQLN